MMASGELSQVSACNIWGLWAKLTFSSEVLVPILCEYESLGHENLGHESSGNFIEKRDLLGGEVALSISSSTAWQYFMLAGKHAASINTIKIFRT